MEDAHSIVLDLDEGANESNAFFAVYDGHGGVCFQYAPAPFHLTLHLKVVRWQNLRVRTSIND
jgi:hypothetical protein